MVGLDEFNQEKLRRLPQAEECAFHAALDISEMRNVEEPVSKTCTWLHTGFENIGANVDRIAIIGSGRGCISGTCRLVLTENVRADAVVQDYARFQKQQETLLMLKLLVQGEADIQADRLHTQADVFAELRAAVKEAGKNV